MKALVLTGPGLVELLEVGEPHTADGDVIVQVRAAGICGSELHGARHPGFRKPPLVMGHEFAGVAEGDEPVIVNPILSCGACEACRRGQRHICQDRQIIGVHRPGGLAERVAVPSSALRPMPGWLSWDAAALVEPAANAVHAWGLAVAGGTGSRARVGVIGCGAIGLLCVVAALAGGAARVDVTDLAAGRLAVAKRLGAAGTRLDGEYDVVIDAAGAAAARAVSVDALRAGGTAVWLGLAEDAPGFGANALIRAEKRVLGSFAYSDEEFAAAMSLLRDCDVSWAASYPLSAGEAVFSNLMNGSTEPVKAVLHP